MALNVPHKATNPNGVHVAGPIKRLEGKVPTGQTVTPGAMIIAAAASGEYDESGVEALDVFGYAMDNTDNTAEDLRTAYAAGERFIINTAPGAEFMGLINGAAGPNDVKHGDLLVTDTDGHLKRFDGLTLAAGDTAKVVAKYMGTEPITTTGARGRCVLMTAGGL